ncbi:hypothetical protein SLS60_005237 [Paraconiothyrium brasiliense]|uniref:C2H2-type domain-containing protein n=1 Tax=Paraconiothyrium brasiliense TaxID=300254 RepID=A0ABR3RGT1_9PLEO
MHKDEEETELIRKSAYRGPIPPSPMSQADMLAGIGVEAQVAGNELDDPASGISLTPDQDENPWAHGFDPGSQKFTLDNERMTRHESDQFLRAPDTYTKPRNGRVSTTPLPPTEINPEKRQRQDSLKVLADLASTQPVTVASPFRHLSSAPQTKAEQQRQVTYAEQQRMALQKFGKALIAECQADPSADGTDLENVVLRILSGTNPQVQAGGNAFSKCRPSEDFESDHPRLDTIMTKTEALKASQAISNLIKHNPTVHKPCGELFQRVELFKQHLVNEHKVDKGSDVSGEAKACRIGKNYQGQFWCGFCEMIVKLKEKRNAAWDERFDHIDAHFNKEKRGIEQWLCVETRKTKGESLQEMDRTRFDEDDGDEDGDGEPDDSPPPTAGGGSNGTHQSYETYSRPPSIPPSMTVVEDVTRKRQYPVEEFAPPPIPKRRRTDVNRYCVSLRALCLKRWY